MLAITKLSPTSLRRPSTQDSPVDAPCETTQHDQRYVESQWAFAPAGEWKSGKPEERPTVGIFNDFASDGIEQQQFWRTGAVRQTDALVQQQRRHQLDQRVAVHAALAPCCLLHVWKHCPRQSQ